MRQYQRPSSHAMPNGYNYDREIESRTKHIHPVELDVLLREKAIADHQTRSNITATHANKPSGFQ